MPENKTQATKVSAAAYIAAIIDEGRRADCAALAKLISKATKLKPVMWGPSIVGFGSYHYKYESGREGDMCLVGFSSRASAISVYLMTTTAQQKQLLERLGKYKMAKACLSIRKLSDIDTTILEKLILGSMAEVKRQHG